MTGRRISICGPCDLVVEEFEVPTSLTAHDLLLDVHYSLISPGTELGGYNGARPGSSINPGYTAVGEVVEVGAGQDADLKGKMVYVFPAIDDCRHCHASHKVVTVGGLTPVIPDALEPKAACFSRVVNIALTPYRNASVRTSGTALVFGLGLVGNMIGQVGNILGFRAIGVEPNAARRTRAMEAGFDAVIDPNAGDAVQAVKDLTDGRGAELTVNATGHSAVFPPAIKATASGGEISTLGGARHGATWELKEIFGEIHSRHLTVRGGWEMMLPMTVSPASKGASTEINLRDAFRWLVSGAVNLEPIWTHTIKPGQFKGAYDALNSLNDEYLGVVVDWA